MAFIRSGSGGSSGGGQIAMAINQNDFVKICKNNRQADIPVGAIVELNNEYCSLYKVIGTNHDDTVNTVDLMSLYQVYTMVFNPTSTNPYYNSSSIRTWINETFISAFDENIQELLKTMSVTTEGTTVNDKAKLLSWKEIGSNNSYCYNTDGGTKYPIFIQNNRTSQTRKRYVQAWDNPGSGNISYWLRSRCNHSDFGNCNYAVARDGVIGQELYNSSFGVAPVIRF